MFSYHLRLALKSLRRSPGVSVLMIGAIALGVGVSITTLTVYRLMSGNPIAHRNEVLYAVAMDSWDPARPIYSKRPELPPSELTYMDAQALLRSNIPSRRVAMRKATFVAERTDSRDAKPFLAETRLTTGDFFPMFDVPFQYGGPWDRSADTAFAFLLNSQSHRLYLLRQMTRELSRQEVATWKKVIRVIAHELNNSLAPISSLAHSGRQSIAMPDPAQLERIFHTIEERARHLHTFIDGYARFAKLPQPLAEAVNWAAFLRSLQETTPFTLASTPPIRAGVFDAAQMEQVLINLVKNAREAGAGDSGIEVRVDEHQAGRRRAETDHLPGSGGGARRASVAGQPAGRGTGRHDMDTGIGNPGGGAGPAGGFLIGVPRYTVALHGRTCFIPCRVRRPAQCRSPDQVQGTARASRRAVAPGVAGTAGPGHRRQPGDARLRARRFGQDHVACAMDGAGRRASARQ